MTKVYVVTDYTGSERGPPLAVCTSRASLNATCRRIEEELDYDHGSMCYNEVDVDPDSNDNFLNYRQFIKLVRQAEKIQSSGADPEVIYHAIFSPQISRAITALGIEVEYCDPDTTYEEDVRAYVDAIRAKAVDIQKIVDALDAED